jgi:hypothetical protein
MVSRSGDAAWAAPAQAATTANASEKTGGENRRRGVCAVFGLTVHRHCRTDIPGIRINSHAGEGRLLGD